MLRKFNPPGASAPPFYSHGAEVSGAQRTLYISGQVGVGPNGIGKGITEQTQLVAANLQAVLAAADMTFADVAKFTIYLTDERNFEGFVQGAAGLLSSPPAATTLLYVKALAAPDMLIEIEAIAVK